MFRLFLAVGALALTGCGGDGDAGNEQGCFERGTCSDDVEAACRRFVDNYYTCVEAAYADDAEQLAQEKASKEGLCDDFDGLRSQPAADTFHCQADAFGIADCSTTEGLNQVVSETQGC